MKGTGKIASLDVWFRGEMAALVNAPTDCVIDDGTLFFVLDELESKLLHLRAEILEVCAA